MGPSQLLAQQNEIENIKRQQWDNLFWRNSYFWQIFRKCQRLTKQTNGFFGCWWKLNMALDLVRLHSCGHTRPQASCINLTINTNTQQHWALCDPQIRWLDVIRCKLFSTSRLCCIMKLLGILRAIRSMLLMMVPWKIVAACCSCARCLRVLVPCRFGTCASTYLYIWFCAQCTTLFHFNVFNIREYNMAAYLCYVWQCYDRQQHVLKKLLCRTAVVCNFIFPACVYGVCVCVCILFIYGLFI